MTEAPAPPLSPRSSAAIRTHEGEHPRAGSTPGRDPNVFRRSATAGILGAMTGPGGVVATDLRELPRPARNRRARRRRGLVLLLFALVSFGLSGSSFAMVRHLNSLPLSEMPEGMAAFAFAFLGISTLLLGCVLAPLGLVQLLKPQVVAAPAWLVDPADHAQVRWWGGRCWTEHTRPRDPATSALQPLEPDNRRRRRRGLLALVGGGAVAGVALWYPSSQLTPVTAVDSGQSDGSGPLTILALNAFLPALLIALVGFYLLLTLANEPMPGWYPDPGDASHLRYWDGQAWTDGTTLAAVDSPP